MILWKIGYDYSIIFMVIYMKYFENGKEVIKTLKQKGFEAYFVGGFVRDKLLGNLSEDIDITTNATPEEVSSVFDNVKNTGKKYGTVTVIFNEMKYEVTTYRFDGEYKDGRRPESVTFSNKLTDDLERRDFTVNALVMDEDEKIQDFHNGVNDLENKIIRTINNPITRFTEDALRMLRAIRFVSKLGFDIETETLNAITELKANIKNVSIERIMVELDKIFRGPYRQKAIKLMVQSRLHEELYGIKEGMEFLQNIEEEVTPVEAFIYSYLLGELDDVWRFSNRNRRLMEIVVNLHTVTKENEFNKFIVFSNGVEICLLTNKVSTLLGYKDQSELINKINSELVVKDVCDLAFKGQDILQLTTLKKRSVIALVIDDLLYNVIMGIMPNEYDVLKEFALQRVDELQREMEE